MLRCDTCGGTGKVPDKWIVYYRYPNRSGTHMVTNGNGGFTYDEATEVVKRHQSNGEMAWLAPVNDGLPITPPVAPEGMEGEADDQH
jgi:hypothetical protein